MHRAVFTIAIGLFAASGAGAQSPAPISIRVHVIDSAGAPIAGADVSVMRGLGTAVAHGVTDERGNQTLSFVAGGDDELVVRKIGYRRVSRFFNDTQRAPSFEITLARTAAALDTVKVAAQEDVRRKSYYIDAESIESSSRIVVDALDVVMKLRPDMIWGRTGQPDRIDQHVSTSGRGRSRAPARIVRQAERFGYCAPVQNIWVNGIRIRNIAIDQAAALKRVGEGLFINAGIATVLASIKPEHIAEVQYHPCTDMEGDSPVRSNNAIMVQLKDGVGFDPGAGSYVAVPRRAAAAERQPVELTSIPLAQDAPDAVAIPRILGVFDIESGQPMAGVDIVDVATGKTAKTTMTGTISLSFLPAGVSRVKIEREGYVPITMRVTMSPKDTVPITIVMERQKPPK